MTRLQIQTIIDVERRMMILLCRMLPLQQLLARRTLLHAPLQHVSESRELLHSRWPTLTQRLALIELLVLLTQVEVRPCRNADSDDRGPKVDGKSRHVPWAVVVQITKKIIIKNSNIPLDFDKPRPDVGRITRAVDQGDCRRSFDGWLGQTARNP